MTPEERAEKREAAVQGMIAKGYTRERAEELLGMVGKALFALFGPNGRFTVDSTDGPLERLATVCPARHQFCGVRA